MHRREQGGGKILVQLKCMCVCIAENKVAVRLLTYTVMSVCMCFLCYKCMRMCCLCARVCIRIAHACQRTRIRMLLVQICFSVYDGKVFFQCISAIAYVPLKMHTYADCRCCIHVRTNIHTCMHTYMHAYTDCRCCIHMRTNIHTYMHTQIVGPLFT